MTDVERLLAGRRLVDGYRAVHASTGEHEVDTMLSGLKELSFDSIDEFFKFNQAMNLAEIKANTEYVGQCDKCAGRPRTCVQSCFEKKTDSGKKELVPDVNDSLQHRKYWKDHYSQPVIKVGETRPIMPGCTIYFKSIRDWRFNIRWE